MKYAVLLFFTVLLLTVAGCRKHVKNSTSPMPENAILIDVRSAEEFNSGHLPGSFNIPHTEIAEKISRVAPDKSTPLYLYCRSGRRVGIAMEALKEIGYSDMHNLGGLEDAAGKLKLEPVKTSN